MKFFSLSLFVVFLNCLPVSINPANNQKQAIRDSSIIGTWYYSSNDTNEQEINISWIDSNSYLIHYKSTDPEVKSFATYSAQLTSINQELIISITLYKKGFSDDNNISENLIIPGYFFARMNRLSDDSILVMLFDYDWILNELKKQKGTLRTIDCDGKTLIADSTEKVRLFISNCMKDKQSKCDTMVMCRSKK